MGGINDSLGTIAVDIVGDYSQLQSDLDAAAASAEAAGQEIANAFNAADSTQVEQLSSTLQQMGPAAEGAAAGLGDAALGEEVLAEGAEVAEAGLGAMLGRLREVGAELAAGFGIVEAGKAVIEMTGELQLASVSLTALTGSAQVAEDQLAELRDMSENEALSFPVLVEAEQRMVAFGVTLDAIPGALQAAADASVAMHTSLDTVANSLERIALSGNLSSRQLVQLGINMHDIAEAMGVADDEAKAMFTDLDESTRIQVLTTAIENIKNFQGLAEKAKDTIPGMTQQIKNSWETAFQDIGTALAPVIEQFAIWIKSIGQAIDLITRLGQASANFVQGKGFQAENLPGAQTPAGPPLQVQDTATRVANLVKTFNADLKTEDWKEAEEIIATLGKLDAPTAQDALQRLAQAEKTAADNARGLGQETDKYKAVVDVIPSSFDLLMGSFVKQEAEVKATANAIEAYGASLADSGVDISKINLPQAYFNDLIAKASANMKEAMDSTPPYVDALKSMATAEEQNVLATNTWIEATPAIKTALKNVADGSYDAAKGLDSMMGKISGPELDAAAVKLAEIDKSLGTDDWRKAESLIKQLAVDDLPKAVTEYQKLIDQAVAHGKAVGDVLALQENLLNLEIQYGEKNGQDVSQQIVALDKVKDEMVALKDQADGLGKVFDGLNTTFMNMWEQFASGIADAIANSKNLGDAMMNVLKQIEAEILKTLIGYVFQQLRDSIVNDMIGPLTQATSQVKNLAMSGEQMVSAMNSGGGGAVAGAVPGAGGGLSSLGGGGLFGAIGAVGSVVSAISGVIGNFQQAHANNLLGEIEVSTRISAMQLEGFNPLFDTYLPKLADIAQFTGGFFQMFSNWTNGGAAAGAGGSGVSLVINGGAAFYGTMTQQDLNNLAAAILRQFKLSGG